jgi:hypothetical protein
MLRLDGSSIDGGLTLDTGMMDAEVFRQEPLWLSPGQELSVTTTGAAVPAFTASLSAPGELELSPAVCTSVGCTRHARTTPLRREWAGRTPGTLLRLTLADTTQRLRCEAFGRVWRVARACGGAAVAEGRKRHDDVGSPEPDEAFDWPVGPRIFCCQSL